MPTEGMRLSRAATLVAVSLCAAPIPGQSVDPADPRVQWLRDNAVELRSVDPADEDFSDLEPLVERIGDARIVQLGEATHGDGATFELKARLVKFLHQRMGFDVVAWEAGIFDMQAVDAALSTAAPVHEAGSHGLYSIWWRAQEVMPTLEYIRASRSGRQPIRVVGFDSRISTPNARDERFPEYVDAFFDRLDASLVGAPERDALRAMSAGLVPADYYNNPGPRDYDRPLVRRLLAALDERAPELARSHDANDIGFMGQNLRSLLAMDRALEAGQGRSAAPDGYSRDAAMAENLMWWLDGELADHKVIVWAHNYHVQEALLVEDSDFALLPHAGPTGRFLADAYGDDVYTVGFLSWSGSHAFAGAAPEPLPRWPATAFESLLHAAGRELLWVDLDPSPGAEWLQEPLPAGFMLYQDPPQTTDWARLYDAVVFIDEQRPATLVPGLR